MRFLIDNGRMYLNNVHFCLAEAGNGSSNLQAGTHTLTSQFSHGHGDVLPNADGAGWIGADCRCDIVLGGVRGRNGVIPSKPYVEVMLARLEVAEGDGQRVTLEIKP
jgi:hypothetical protein